MRGPVLQVVRLAMMGSFFLSGVSGCRDLSSFTTSGDHFQGTVVSADFVRAGVDPGVELCLTLDADHLEDSPGVLSTSDGRFHAVPLRPIPQIWHDPLSTLSFGEGRSRNLVYVAAASVPFGDGNGNDAFAVLSLMQSGDVELRLLRSAPALAATASDATTVPNATDASEATGPSASAIGNVFAVFDLSRKKGPCSY